jgi:enoyl-CoA hydratase/carnithine racemase
MAEPQVLYETDGKVGIVTLNRPNKLNALSMELRLEVERVLHSADDEAGTSVIVLRAEGRSFCVGFDVGGGHAQQGTLALRCAEMHQRLGISVRMMTPWTPQASDRVGARTRARWRLRAGDVLRPHHRGRQRGVRRARDAVLAS